MNGQFVGLWAMYMYVQLYIKDAEQALATKASLQFYSAYTVEIHIFRSNI